MAEVKLRKFAMMDGKLPGAVKLLLSDHESEEEATVWVEARLPLEAPMNSDAIFAFMAALAKVEELAREACDNLGSVHLV